MGVEADRVSKLKSSSLAPDEKLSVLHAIYDSFMHFDSDVSCRFAKTVPPALWASRVNLMPFSTRGCSSCGERTSMWRPA